MAAHRLRRDRGGQVESRRTRRFLLPNDYGHHDKCREERSDPFANASSGISSCQSLEASFDHRKALERIRERRPASATTVTHMPLLFHQTIARSASRATHNLNGNYLHIDAVIVHAMLSVKIGAQPRLGTWGYTKATLVLRYNGVKKGRAAKTDPLAFPPCPENGRPWLRPRLTVLRELT